MQEVTSVFSPEEWDRLTSGPLYMLGQVAGADSHIDRAEWAALMAAVAGAAGADHPLVREVMSAAAERLTGADAAVPGELAPLDGLRAVNAILTERHPEDESGLRETLLEIGGVIAEASGPKFVRTFFNNHGRDGWAPAAKTTAMERAALQEAAEALGMVAS